MLCMYTDPFNIPTQVARMNSRQLICSGKGDMAVDIEGYGFPGERVAFAEMLKEACYGA